MRERLSDERVAEIATTYLAANPICLKDSDGENVDLSEEEVASLAREVRDRREAERRDAAWVALGKAAYAVGPFFKALGKLTASELEFNTAISDVQDAAVRGAAKEEGGDGTLCDDCGHPESWHTGSFTSCNHPSDGWCHCEGYVAPSPEKAGGS